MRLPGSIPKFRFVAELVSKAEEPVSEEEEAQELSLEVVLVLGVVASAAAEEESSFDHSVCVDPSRDGVEDFDYSSSSAVMIPPPF